MRNASLIAHDGLAFANPMSETAIDFAIGLMAIGSESTVLETGCGNGEILRRTVQAHPGCVGLGVDNDPDVIDQARGLPSERTRFEVLHAADVAGRFDAVINVAASHVHGGFPSVLTVLRAFDATTVLYGDGFWRRAPSAGFLDALGGATADELSDLYGLRQTIADAGFAIEHEALASDKDWAFYEETLAENAERYGSPDSLAYARRIRDRRALINGTDTLGFALFVLRRIQARRDVSCG